MALGATKFCRHLLQFCPCIRQYSSTSSSQSLEEAIKAAVEAKLYQKIPDFLHPLREKAFRNPNPFSFLSSFPLNHRTQVVDELLQALIPLRPRSRPQFTYAHLLCYTLQSSSPFPLSLAIIQQTLRSGSIPFPQTHLLLSSAWLKRRQSQWVADILLETRSIGYDLDTRTCNYLILSLCSVDHVVEAIQVLKGMRGAGCVTDLESYGPVINSLCAVRKTVEVVDMMKEMVGKVRLTPRQGMIVKMVAALRANREILRAIEMIEFLEKKGYLVGFESYEIVVEGCLESCEYILAAKVVVGMTERGFIPYIRVRQKIVEGLTGIGEEELVCNMRQRFAELKS